MREPNSPGRSAVRLGRPIVVEAGQPQTHLRSALDVAGQLDAQLVHAADGVAPRVEAASPQPLLNLSQHDAGQRPSRPAS